MAGRTYQAHGVVEFCVAHSLDGFDHAPNRTQRGFPGSGRGHRVRVDVAAATGNEVAHSRDVACGMNQLKRRRVGPARFPNLELIPRPTRSQAANNGAQPLRPLWVSRPRLMPQKRRRVRQPRPHAKLNTSPLSNSPLKTSPAQRSSAHRRSPYREDAVRADMRGHGGLSAGLMRTSHQPHRVSRPRASPAKRTCATRFSALG